MIPHTTVHNLQIEETLQPDLLTKNIITFLKEKKMIQLNLS